MADETYDFGNFWDSGPSYDSGSSDTSLALDFISPDYSWAGTDFGNFWDSGPSYDFSSLGGSSIDSALTDAGFDPSWFTPASSDAISNSLIPDTSVANVLADAIQPGISTMGGKTGLGGTLGYFLDPQGRFMNTSSGGAEDLTGIRPSGNEPGLTGYYTEGYLARNDYDNQYAKDFSRWENLYKKGLVDVTDRPVYEPPQLTEADYGVSGRPSATGADVSAMSPELRDMMVRTGLISPKEALQYALQGDWKAGEMFLDTPEKINAYVKAYGQDVLSNALGGIENPINQKATELQLKAAGMSDGAVAKVIEAIKQQSGVGDKKVTSDPNKLKDVINKLQGGLKVASTFAGLGNLLNKNETPLAARGSSEGVNWGGGGQRAAPKYYAHGGKVKSGLGTVTIAIADKARAQGLIPGEEGGQDDVVDIVAAPGEYVVDAEVVSALGDGNNEAGAKKLDEMRYNVRKHKRSGGLSSIPPKAKHLSKYMKG